MKFRQRAILKPENLLFGAARLDERPGAEGAFIAKEESGVTAAKYLGSSGNGVGELRQIYT